MKINPLNCKGIKGNFQEPPNVQNVLFAGDILFALPKSLFSDLSGYIFSKNDQILSLPYWQ